MVTPEADEVSDEDFSDMNPSSPSAGPPPSAEQRGRSRRDERSRSRERAHPHSSSQYADEDSATVDPQKRVSGRVERSPQEQEGSRRQGPQNQKGKKTVAEKQPSELTEVPESTSPLIQVRTMKNLETSLEPLEPLNLLYQHFLITLVMKTVSTAMKKVHKVGTGKGALFYPDLYVLTNDEHWTMTPQTHKYAAAAGSFCFSMSENGDQQDICNLITMPCVQRSLYLNGATNDFDNIKVEVPKGVDGQTRDMLERCVATCGKAAGARAKMRSRARKEASAQEVRGHYKQFAEAKHLEHRSCVDNEVFDLIDMRKNKPRNYVTGRWVLTIKTDKQGNFLRAKGQMGIERFPSQAERLLTG